MPTSISWVSIDIGNTLVNDEAAMLLFYRMLLDEIRRREPSFSFERLMRERERLILDERDDRPWATIGRTYLGDNGWADVRAAYLAEIDTDYTAHIPPLPGVGELLADLSGRYRLAVAANQGTGCRVALDSLGWLKYFDLLWISDEVGTRKPEREFFVSLLDAAGCAPAEAVMIGDRLDADIRPARALGLRTIHALVSPGLASDGSPEAELYLASLKRARVGHQTAGSADETPDAVVASLDQIPAAIERL